MRFNTPKTLIPQKVIRRRIIRFIKRAFWSILALLVIIQLYRINVFLDSANSKDINKSASEIEYLNQEIKELREYFDNWLNCLLQ